VAVEHGIDEQRPGELFELVDQIAVLGVGQALVEPRGARIDAAAERLEVGDETALQAGRPRRRRLTAGLGAARRAFAEHLKPRPDQSGGGYRCGRGAHPRRGLRRERVVAVKDRHQVGLGGGDELLEHADAAAVHGVGDDADVRVGPGREHRQGGIAAGVVADDGAPLGVGLLAQ
jgi:hypothetical protein